MPAWIERFYGGRCHELFILEVKTKEEAWSLEKSFTDFVKFNQQLLETLDSKEKSSILPFPKDGLPKKKNELVFSSAMDERRFRLENYFKSTVFLFFFLKKKEIKNIIPTN